MIKPRFCFDILHAMFIRFFSKKCKQKGCINSYISLVGLQANSFLPSSVRSMNIDLKSMFQVAKFSIIYTHHPTSLSTELVTVRGT